TQNVAVWDTVSGDVQKWPTTLERSPRWLAISRDGQCLAVCDSVGGIEFYDLATMKLLHRISHDALVPHVNYLDLGPDGKTLATSGTDRVAIWDVASGKLLQLLGGSESRAAPIAIFTAGFALWAAAWGLILKRRSKTPPAPRPSMPFRSLVRPILGGALFLVVVAIVLIEVTVNQFVDWRDVRSSVLSLSAQEIGSLLALPILIAVLIRQLAQRPKTQPTGNVAAQNATQTSQPNS